MLEGLNRYQLLGCQMEFLRLATGKTSRSCHRNYAFQWACNGITDQISAAQLSPQYRRDIESTTSMFLSMRIYYHCHTIMAAEGLDDNSGAVSDRTSISSHWRYLLASLRPGSRPPRRLSCSAIGAINPIS